ncbi:hypothetical protein N9K20_04370 [Methylophilaceae bacterium]|nr:hypothetical protein [Methylophilaceae bacterium]
MKKLILILLLIPNLVMAEAYNFDLVNKLSYCGASSLAQSIWNRNADAGNQDVANTLERGAVAYGNIAIEFGAMNSISKESVIMLNRKNNTKVSQEIKDGFFFDGESLKEKNNNCTDILKNNPTLLGIWQHYFNK